MINTNDELELFERLSFQEKLDLINSSGAKLEAKFHKGHLLELYSMGNFFVRVRYTGNRPDQINAFLYNEGEIEFFVR